MSLRCCAGCEMITVLESEFAEVHVHSASSRLYARNRNRWCEKYMFVLRRPVGRSWGYVPVACFAPLADQALAEEVAEDAGDEATEPSPLSSPPTPPPPPPPLPPPPPPPPPSPPPPSPPPIPMEWIEANVVFRWLPPPPPLMDPTPSR